MGISRRSALQGLLGFFTLLGSGVLTPGVAFANWLKSAFNAKDTRQALTALYGAPDFIASDRVRLTIPDVAENGAIVPINVSSDLPNVSAISILAEKNPRPLVATFTLPEGTLADTSLRIRLAETTVVKAVVTSDGKLYGAAKEVQVTIGGCGG